MDLRLLLSDAKNSVAMLLHHITDCKSMMLSVAIKFTKYCAKGTILKSFQKFKMSCEHHTHVIM